MLEEAFKNYVSHYDINDEHIALKINHSLRVMKLQEKYAKLLGYKDEDIEIAKVIGLLHDFGRFEQWRVYHTFVDLNSVDHADYSVHVLFDENYIDNFEIPEKWYPIVKFAIKNHNKLEVANCSDERMLEHAKLIRDTDKIDILYLLGVLGELNNKPIDHEVSEDVLKIIMRGECVDKKYLKNMNDRYSLYFTFAFNIYHDECLEEFLSNMKAYYKRLGESKYFTEIYNYVVRYCEERMNKKC